MTVRRLVRTDYQLQDAADSLGVSLEDAARDLALLSVIASLVGRFGERIVFKGGAVLRFGHGASRTSRDADATVIKPAQAPIPADEVIEAINDARMGQFLRVTAPAEPRTDNFHSLDVDRVAFSCAEVEGTLDVEFSYREGVHLEPIRAAIGDPYFESFQADTMRPVEMAAEKLRTLVQRQRGTDLADCVLLEQLSQGGELHLLAGARAEKFKLVRDGVGPDHVRERIDALADRYETDVRAVDLDAPDYATARAAAFRLVRAAWT
jgi:predicted nucleotidyltransferase component of viral defense system